MVEWSDGWAIRRPGCAGLHPVSQDAPRCFVVQLSKIEFPKGWGVFLFLFMSVFLFMSLFLFCLSARRDASPHQHLSRYGQVVGRGVSPRRG